MGKPSMAICWTIYVRSLPHVTIGKAWKVGKETENYFMLLREDGADLDY